MNRYAVQFLDGTYLGFDNKGAMASGYPCRLSLSRAVTYSTVGEAIALHSWAVGLYKSTGIRGGIPRKARIVLVER